MVDAVTTAHRAINKSDYRYLFWNTMLELSSIMLILSRVRLLFGDNLFVFFRLSTKLWLRSFVLCVFTTVDMFFFLRSYWSRPWVIIFRLPWILSIAEFLIAFLSMKVSSGLIDEKLAFLKYWFLALTGCSSSLTNILLMLSLRIWDPYRLWFFFPSSSGWLPLWLFTISSFDRF